MKVGDKVRVKSLVTTDMRVQENLKIGCEGTIVEVFEGDIFAVMFSDGVIESRFAENTNRDGSYDMFNWQLEVVESEVTV